MFVPRNSGYISNSRRTNASYPFYGSRRFSRRNFPPLGCLETTRSYRYAFLQAGIRERKIRWDLYRGCYIYIYISNVYRRSARMENVRFLCVKGNFWFKVESRILLRGYKILMKKRFKQMINMDKIKRNPRRSVPPFPVVRKNFFLEKNCGRNSITGRKGLCTPSSGARCEIIIRRNERSLKEREREREKENTLLSPRFESHSLIRFIYLTQPFERFHPHGRSMEI